MRDRVKCDFDNMMKIIFKIKITLFDNIRVKLMLTLLAIGRIVSADFQVVWPDAVF